MEINTILERFKRPFPLIKRNDISIKQRLDLNEIVEPGKIMTMYNGHNAKNLFLMTLYILSIIICKFQMKLTACVIDDDLGQNYINLLKKIFNKISFIKYDSKCEGKKSIYVCLTKNPDIKLIKMLQPLMCLVKFEITDNIKHLSGHIVPIIYQNQFSYVSNLLVINTNYFVTDLEDNIIMLEVPKKQRTPFSFEKYNKDKYEGQLYFYNTVIRPEIGKKLQPKEIKFSVNLPSNYFNNIPALSDLYKINHYFELRGEAKYQNNVDVFIEKNIWESIIPYYEDELNTIWIKFVSDLVPINSSEIEFYNSLPLIKKCFILSQFSNTQIFKP